MFYHKVCWSSVVCADVNATADDVRCLSRLKRQRLLRSIPWYVGLSFVVFCFCYQYIINLYVYYNCMWNAVAEWVRAQVCQSRGPGIEFHQQRSNHGKFVYPTLPKSLGMLLVPEKDDSRSETKGGYFISVSPLKYGVNSKHGPGSCQISLALNTVYNFVSLLFTRWYQRATLRRKARTFSWKPSTCYSAGDVTTLGYWNEAMHLELELSSKEYILWTD